MDKVKNPFDSAEHAKNYDEKAKAASWLGSEILLQLSRQYIQPGESILDLGIGTGLTSVLFRASGLRVYGMDFSGEMLKVCKTKKIAEDLKEHDLREKPYPYADASMDHIICGGVLHIFEDLRPIFEEVSRIVRKGGTFTFTCADHADIENKIEEETNHKHMGKKITIYRHSQAVIEEKLKNCNLILRATSDFFVKLENNHKRQFKAYLAIKD
jgi:ubiquinone/menaquinone biosynthesis C-methylase UbiE